MNNQRQPARHPNDATSPSYVHLGGRHWVRRVARTMASLLVLQSALSVLPAYAQSISASSGAPAGQRPILDAARNGVPIVHIAPPSKAGVSRNQYDQFNVNQNGLILNNSTGNVQTQQGGWITGNLQLGPTPARIILNEVVGANSSQLRGTIEVAGQSAAIVIANPNGITCDGCGFLNTERATLSTGRPQFAADGAIQGFDVRQGQLTVGANGLNATNLEQLDLLARGIVIEGEVWAKNLNAIAGANQVLYGTMQAAVQTGTGAAPRFAIDIKDLGGMYANQVYLVATEQGLGVNSTGRMAALQGNLALSANGDLSLHDSYAKQNIRIAGAGSVRLTGVTQSEGATSITAAGALDNSGASLLAGGDLNIRAGAIANNANSHASKIAAAGNIDIQGSSINNDSSSITAGGNVTIGVGALSNRQGAIEAGGTLDVNTGALENAGGRIVSGDDLSINSARFDNNRGTTASIAGRLTVDTRGQDLNNDRGLLQAAGDVAIDTQGKTLTNTNSGNDSGIVAGGALSIKAGNLDNKAGFVASDGSQTITVAGNVENSALDAQAGQIVSNADSRIAAANVFNNGGRIDVLHNLELSTGVLDNRGGQVAAGGAATLSVVKLENGAQAGVAGAIDAKNVTVTAGSIGNVGGAIRAGNDARFSTGTGTLDNSSGALTAKRNLSIDAATLANNGGRLIADSEVAIETSSESPGGTIASSNNVKLKVNGNFSNNTLLSAQKNLTIDASNIDNSGKLIAGETLTASTGNLINSGEISGNAVFLNVSRTLTNTATGLIDGVDTNIAAFTTNNTGRIYGDWLRIGGNTLNNSGSGTIAARDTLLIGVKNLNNTNGGLIYSLGDIGMAGSIDASGQLQGSMQSLVNASSKIEAGRNLSIDSAGILNRNDGLATTRVTEGPVNEDRVQPTNTSAQFPTTLCYGIGGGQDDNGCIVHPDKFGQRSIISPARSEVCTGSWDSQSCSMQPNYQWNSPIFAQYQVAPVGPPPPEPAGRCTAPSGDSGDLPVDSPECNQWRSNYAAWDGAFQNALNQLAPKIDAYNAEVNEDNRIHHFEDYTWFQVTSTKSHTAVVSSAPGKIQAGGSISLTGAVTNRDSEIVAGSALSVSGPTPVNDATKGEDRTEYSGTTQYTQVDPCGAFGRKHCRNWGPRNPYELAPYVVPADLSILRYDAFAGNQTAFRDLTVATTGADAGLAASVAAAAGISLDSIARVAPTPLTIPQSSLFTLNIDSKAPYLVKADPRFTNYRDFIGSDYLLQALNRDPERQIKRYGDGFTEQQLINDQILALTGRHYLSGYTSTEDEYKALMDAGVAFGRRYQLSPGVALTAEQMSLLTTDIVWLTTRTVMLPDGSTQQVLAPQVYLRRPAGKDLQPTGALMAANDVRIMTEGDLVNSGTISGDRVIALAGGDVVNQGGRISGRDVLMRANNDLKNLSGVIAGTGADSIVTLLAGRDIVLQTRTSQTANDDGTSARTNVQRIATVQGGSVRLDAGRDLVALGAGVEAQKDVIATAGRDITVAAVAGEYQLNVKDRSGASVQGRTGYIRESATSNQIATLSAGKSVVLAATGDVKLKGADISAGTTGMGDALIQGRNVSIESVTDRAASDIQMVGSKNYTRFAREDEAFAGGSVAAADNISIRATGETRKDGNIGGDISVTGAYLSSEKGQATLAANNDIAIRNGTTRHTAIDESYSKSGNLLQRVTTTKSDSTAFTQVEASAISGNTVALKAGNDLSVRGSSIVGNGDVTLSAQSGNVEIAAAQASSTESHYRYEKRSGIAASGVGLGITIGTSEKKSNFDGATTTESESRSAVGSTGGNLIITAGKDATIKGSDLIAGKAAGDTQDATGHIDIQAQNIKIEPGTDTSRTKATQEAKQSGVTTALVGTPLDSARNLKDVQKNPSKFGRVRGTLDEIANSSMTTPQVAVNFDRSKSSSQVTTSDLVNSGSSLTAAGDIRLRATGNGAKDGTGKAANGDITVTGSTIMAGGTAMLDAERNITLQASTDHYQESSQATSSSTHFSTAIPSLGDLGRAIGGGPNNSGVGGFPYGKANSSGIGDSTASTQTATLVSGNNVVLNSRSGDIRIAGSGADAVQDINVIAKRGQIDISSGQDSRRRQEEQSSHAVGDLGSNAKDGSMGTGFTVGEKREHSTLDTTQAQQSTIRSQLSAGGNITLDAKEDITATGIDLRAGRDLTAIGKNVYLDPGQDTVHTLQSSEMSQVGVTVSTSGYAVEAAKALEQAAKATEQKDDKRLAALYGAKAALTVYNGMGAPSGSSAANPQSQAIVKVTASIGSSSAESTSENAATQNIGSTLTAGGTVTVIATGSGEKDAAGKAVDGDISARGTLISGTNVELIAARDINLQSAKDTTHNGSSDSSRNASIGVGFALGGQQNGFTLELAAAKAEGNANGDSITHRNTIVTASDTLIVNSGRDTNLNGAQVRGETVIANIGRDLNIASQQDVDTYHSKQDSAGFSASVCVPPFCYGTTVEASANAAKANTDSTYQSVKEQSGLYAGKGGFDVTVKGNTDLKGAVLASDAEANKNRLVTGTLTTSDIENKAEYKSDSSSLSLSYSGGSSNPDGSTTAPAGIKPDGKTAPGSALQTIGSNLASNAAGNAISAKEGTTSGTTKSAISAGTLVITDQAGQVAKTGKTADETIASVSRDTGTANGSIQKIFDLKKLQQEQEYQKVMSEVAQQAAPIVYKEIGDRLDGQPTEVKVAVHALVGGLMSKAIGGEFGSGATGAAAATLAVETFAKDIGGIEGLSKGDKDALITMMGLTVGKITASATSETSASNAAAVTAKLATQYNYLKHDQWAKYAQERSKCKDDKGCQNKVDTTYREISALQDIRLATCDQTGDCATLVADVYKGTEEMLRLVHSGKLPEEFAGTRDLQYLGTHLATSSTLRMHVTRALEAKQLCDTNPAQCDKQAMNVALTVGGAVVGGGAIALLVRSAPALAAAAKMGLDACLSNIRLCANQAGIVVSEVAAGDALGGAGLATLGTVAATKGTKIAGAVADEAAEAARWVTVTKTVGAGADVGPPLRGKVLGQFDMVSNPGPLAMLPNNPAANFAGGRYSSITLTEDVILYRGGDSNGKALGQWFTSEPPSSLAQVRIDSAVRPQWVDPKTGQLSGSSPIDAVYTVKIPAGTTVYRGPVATQGGVYVGGQNVAQIFVPEPWKIPGVQVIGQPKPLK